MAKSTEAVTNPFSMVSDPVRRYVIYYLDEQETPVNFDRLATRIAAWHTNCVPMRSWNESSVSSQGVTGG